MRTNDFHLPTQWTLLEEGESVAQFTNPLRDLLSIHHFAIKPDIEADVSDTDALRKIYRNVAESNGLAMLEVDSTQIAGLVAVKTLFKVRLQPRGLGFMGSYTFPFADHSYVIKVQSEEQGITGLRETAVLHKTLGGVDGFGELQGWQQDPYEPSRKGAFMRNRADDPEYDSMFPDHPLSKVRGYLAELAEKLEVAADIRNARPFKYTPAKSGFWAWIEKVRFGE